VGTTTVAEQVVQLLANEGPLTDVVIAQRLGISRESAVATCRQLEIRKAVRRGLRSDGRTITHLVSQPFSSTSEGSAETVRLITEDEVKIAMKNHLERNDHEVAVIFGQAEGIDIEARSEDGRILIEARGEAASPQQATDHFLSALGAIVRWMTDPDARYGLALPDNKVYRELVQKLPSLGRSRLNLTVFYVKRDADGKFEVSEEAQS
jgi:DNA-binding transcriptional MocR family regulator